MYMRDGMYMYVLCYVIKLPDENITLIYTISMLGRKKSWE